MGPHRSREQYRRIPFVCGIVVITVTRIPPADLDVDLIPSDTDPDYDYDHDYDVHDMSGIEDWMAGGGD